MEKLQEERSFKLIPLYLKALCIAFIISLIFILLLSIILSVTKVSEEIENVKKKVLKKWIRFKKITQYVCERVIFLWRKYC